MARKTNKTAHVLNLITNPSKETEDEVLENSTISTEADIPIENSDNVIDSQNTEAPKVVLETPKKAEPSKPATPVVEILSNEHDPLSDLIKNVLSETSQESEMKNTAPKIKPSVLSTAAIIEEPKSVEDAKVFDFSLEFDEEGNEIEHITPEIPSEPETSLEPEISPEPEINIEPEIIPVAEPTVTPENLNQAASILENDKIIDECDCNSTQLLEQLEIAKNMHFHDRKDLNSMVDLDFKYINVYEIIVQDKLLDYMKKFDVCMCDRCIIDTFALAVTALPTKIVVVDKKEIFPLVNFFEVQNTAIISTALIKACMIVKDKPNHSK